MSSLFDSFFSGLASSLARVAINLTKVLIVTIVTSNYCEAFTLLCTVNKKYDYALYEIHSSESLAKWQFSIEVLDDEQSKTIRRCSYSVVNKGVTCDSYPVDKVAVDPWTRIRKYYVFNAHFDVQIFPDLVFIENNGRGGLATGSCVLQ